MEFFRKYQRVILYSAGLFALVSFSITGPILAWVEGLRAESGPQPTIVVGGKTVSLLPEDQRVASDISRWELRNGGMRAFVMPNISSFDDTNDAVRTYAAMRRVAIELGIEVSDDEVDRALEQAVQLVSAADPEVTTPTQLAVRRGFASLDAFRDVVREAMRIGTLARIEALGIDTSDARLAELMLRDLEMVGLDVAVIDSEALEEAVKEELGEIPDETLAAWLEDPETEPMQRSMMTDPDKFQADLPYIELAALDLTQFADELGEFEVEDAEIDRFYTTNRAMLYRIPVEEEGGEDGGEQPEDGGEQPEDGGEQPEDGGKGGDGGAGQDGSAGEQGSGEQGAGEQGGGESEAGDQGEASSGDAESGGSEEDGSAEAENQDAENQDSEVPTSETADQQPPAPQFRELDDALRAEIRTRLQAEKVVEKLWETVQERFEAHLEPGLVEQDTAVEARDALALALIDAQAAAAAEDLDEAAQAAADAAVEAAETALEAGETAVEAAETAMETRRAGFDLAGLWTGELANGRAGFGVARTGDEPLPTTDLTEIEPIGNWPGAGRLFGLTDERPFGTQVQHTEKHVFQTFLVERDEQPLKPMEDIREEATSRYISSKADERAKEVFEAFEAKVDEMARAKVAEKITELETERDAKVEEQLDEWRTALNEKIAERRARLERFRKERGEFAKPTRAEQARLAAAEEELANEDDKRSKIVKELEEETEGDVDELLAEQYPEILAAAVEAVDGVVLEKVGPLPGDLGTGSRGARKQNYSKAVQWAFFTKRLADLDDVGDAVELTEDTSLRAWFLPVVTSVEPATIQALTRRQLVAMRQEQAGSLRVGGLIQSYDLDALKARYGWKFDEEEAGEESGDPQ